MARFEVWAPRAGSVALVAGPGEPRAMAPQPSGWWMLDAPDLGPGDRYAYSIDGGPPRPDPRSRSQPDGVLGASQLVDDEFAWTDHGWRGIPLQGSVLYELHVGTFTPEGTFDAAIDRLAHLVELGIDAVELLPVASSSGEHGWGYDGAALFSVHHAYGGIDGMRRFVDACHAHGIGVVLDVVYNHLGPVGNHLADFGPYFHGSRATNWGDAVNLDGPDSDEVRRFFLDNALLWLRDLHCDGLRLDAVHALEDVSPLHLLEQLAEEVGALSAHLGRTLVLIAESDRNDPRYVRSRDAGGFGLDSAWADEWHHALHAVLTGEWSGYYEDFGPLGLLGKALTQAWVYDGTWSAHRRRVHGRPPTGLDGSRFVISAQNHDQIGNRAAGERLIALVGTERALVAAALLLTSPFTPMLFQGEEWGASSPFQYFTDHHDPELGRAVTEGRRREFAHFGWEPDEVPDPQDRATFERSKLDWSELDRSPHDEVLRWHRELLALRRQEPDLTDPRLARTAVTVDEDRATIDLRRGAVHVLVNLGRAPHRFELDGATELLAAPDPAALDLDPTGATVPPDGVAIVRLR